MMIFTGTNKLMNVEDQCLDGHAHVFTRDLPMTRNRRYTPGKDATLEEYISLLRINGLNGALLVQPSFLGSDNRFLVETLINTAEHDRMTFKGVVVIEPDTTEHELKRLNAAGVVGMRLNMLGTRNKLDLSAWSRILSLADGMGWHIELQAQGQALQDLLSSLLKKCSTVVVDHFGLPNQAAPFACTGFQALLNAPKERVFVKLSAPYRIFPDAETSELSEKSRMLVLRLIEHFGPGQLLWGSDWPWTQYEAFYNYRDTRNWLGDWINFVRVKLEQPSSTKIINR